MRAFPDVCRTGQHSKRTHRAELMTRKSANVRSGIAVRPRICDRPPMLLGPADPA